ncbi:hypothetical protein KCV87_05040 [Actinosynnema pretiosum subsp. pretiosum]|uniref:TerD domain-containing protein n=1 Tax=Actinosynnema pretiosum subsp. pretiosum TaxID=103721 RepID=A0AA45L917_9PSEU|nr:hypothetical protein APASM_3015 [Actinosynnema pretiosum subsp. pretiosum]QUF05472.1 hypothetical protein KCV87_05040 [Actinosynnema pretiosum subsp. pretiosum]
MPVEALIRRTLRVPRAAGATTGDPGAAVARQFDVVLLSAGFKATRDLLAHLSALPAPVALDLAATAVRALRELVADHVRHTPYFRDFPEGVPDTVEFWLERLAELVTTQGPPEPGPLNLLALPGYGVPRHTHADVLAAHDEFVPSARDRVTTVHLGLTEAEELAALYLDLAGSPTPLTAGDLELLAELAETHLDGPHPERVPVRENRAVLNAARLAAGLAPDVDTTKDVLRLACRASGGDVTLARPTRFRSFRRPERRLLLTALDRVATDPAKLADVATLAEPWKRLGERLHPHEHPALPHAAEVFAVARGERGAPGLASRVEHALATEGPARAAALLASSPGALARALDRLLRLASPDESEVDSVLSALRDRIGEVSGRVLCSLRDHLATRATPAPARLFTTRNRTAWFTPDTRPPLPEPLLAEVIALLDGEIARRLPDHPVVLFDPDVLDVALPLSGKATQDGFAVLPRGSRTRLDLADGEVLRLFAHWKQRAEPTDYDLSALLLDADFGYRGHVSWTNYRGEGGAVYSGDVTNAPEGATEFIDLPLAGLDAHCVVPQLHRYSGESFDRAEEALFGWMQRDHVQSGAPFDPRTVRTRSDLRDPLPTAVPAVFVRDGDGWVAVWTHLHLSGTGTFASVETTGDIARKVARSLVERRYLTVAHLLDLLRAKGSQVLPWTGEPPTSDVPPLYVGLDRPEGLPDNAATITRENLNRLLPE